MNVEHDKSMIDPTNGHNFGIKRNLEIVAREQ